MALMSCRSYYCSILCLIAKINLIIFFDHPIFNLLDIEQND